MATLRVRLELSLQQLDQLHTEANAVRSTSSSVRVSKDLLHALLRDHSRLAAAVEGRGITVED